MNLLQMSVTGGIMIGVVAAVRAVLIHRVLKRTFFILWGIVLARLLIPFSIPSMFSVYTLLGHKIPPPDLTPAVTLLDASHFAADEAARTTVYTPKAYTGIINLPVFIWAIGGLTCALFFGMLYWRCWQAFRVSLPVQNAYAEQWMNAHPLKRPLSIRQSSQFSSPLTYGVLHPVILMPKTTDWEDLDTIQFSLTHEYVHIRRFDMVTKLALIAALCLHWFNPLVWMMYILANRDIELSCDEAVIRSLGDDIKSAYARALIRMEETRSILTPLCNNFSKDVMEERIEMIMKMKKTTVFSFALAACVVVGTTAAFATSAKIQGADTYIYPGTQSMMSYRNPDDGKTYYSWDDGKTFVPLTDAEFEEKFPSPKIEWWTYEDYKAWVEEQKRELPSIIGCRGYTSSLGHFVWTQEMVDETIADYEETLEEIKNGAMLSKSVDGDPNLMVGYDSYGISSRSDHMVGITLKNGEEHVFGPYETKEELLAVVEPFCKTQVALGNMEQTEADMLLEKLAAK